MPHKRNNDATRTPWLPAGALRWGILFMVELYGGEVEEHTALDRLRAITGKRIRAHDASKVISELVAANRLRLGENAVGQRVFRRRRPRLQYAVGVAQIRQQFSAVRRELAKAQRLAVEGARR